MSISESQSMPAPLVSHRQAAASGEPFLRMAANALTAVTSVVPSSAAAFVRFSRRFAVEGVIALDAGNSTLSPRWPQHVAEGYRHPPLEPREVAATGRTIVALDGRGAELDRLGRVLRAAGVGDQICMYLRVAGAVRGSVTIVRGEHVPRYTRRDVSAFGQLQPLAERAFAAVALIAPGPETLPDLGLSLREREVARLVGRGSSNAEIAHALGIEEATVKTHLTRIFGKLGVRSRTQLALAIGKSDPEVQDDEVEQ